MWFSYFFYRFGQGGGQILLDNVRCYSTNFLHLLSCQYSTAVSRTCNHANDVAVACCKRHCSLTIDIWHRYALINCNSWILTVHQYSCAISLTDSTHLSDVPYELRVRLVEGQYPSQGRVEVYCNGQWGTICSTSRFGATEAVTVCRQLGYTDASRYNHLSL